MISHAPLSKFVVVKAVAEFDGGIASCHLDLSAYSADEILTELRSEGYGGSGLAGSDDYPEPE